jgi:hypothetical protein
MRFFLGENKVHFSFSSASVRRVKKEYNVLYGESW